MTLNDPYPRFQGHDVLWCWVYQKRYEIHSFNGIETYTCPTQQCHFEWRWVSLSDLAKYSMTRRVAQFLCDSWASCLLRYGDLTIFNMADVFYFGLLWCHKIASGDTFSWSQYCATFLCWLVLYFLRYVQRRYGCTLMGYVNLGLCMCSITWSVFGL